MKENSVGVSFAKYLLFSYIVTGIILVIISFLQWKLQMNENGIMILLTLTYIFSAGFAGYFAGRRVEQRGFLYGLCMGGLYFLVLVLISLCVKKSTIQPNGEFVRILFLCASSGMLGGILGKNRDLG